MTYDLTEFQDTGTEHILDRDKEWFWKNYAFTYSAAGFD